MTAGDAADSDEFGYSVSVSGDTVVVGSRRDDDGGTFSGSAYVFTRSGSTWSEQAKLVDSNAVAFDEFGSSVSVYGDTVVVGSYGDDDFGNRSGSAFVFTRSGSSWSQQAQLVASDAFQGNEFGSSVSISGDTVVVGSRFGRSVDGTSRSGSAYVFTRNGSSWSEQAKVSADDATTFDEFGFSVSVSGETVVVGSRRDDVSKYGQNIFNAGSAYVFDADGGLWSQQDHLFASSGDPLIFAEHGTSVAVDGDLMVVGDSSRNSTIPWRGSGVRLPT